MTVAPSPLPESPSPPLGGSYAKTQNDLVHLLRWAWYSLGLNLALSVIHGAVAYMSGSLAVTAELLHNVVDMASAVAVIVGLKLAARKSRAFPYGLYKVENMVATGVAVLIFFTAYEIAASAILYTPPAPEADVWMIVTLIATMTVPLIFSHFEMRIAVRANSPALTANAREYRVHAYTTGLALAALLSSKNDFPLDRIAALLITIAVAKTGWDLLVDALRVLLDASISPKELDDVSRLIAQDPAVIDVHWVTARNAGRVRFIETGVSLRPTASAATAAAITRIEQSVQKTLPQVERMLVQVESNRTGKVLYAAPLADLNGTISAHFGDAPYFAFITVDRESHTVEDQRFRANPYRNEKQAKGLRVAEWLVEMKIDRVWVPKDLEGKGPAYAFGEAGIQVNVTSALTLEHLFGAGGAPLHPDSGPDIV